ncbi:DUF389 domain-containing protein [Paraclostridium bifermentans]|nr:DUF389 domain-containing protein [Paraclostridium bifermentans]
MNATAVIIGAMLISPLMGSIIGIGYGVGTYNVKLLREAFKILIISIVISIVTSTLYFSITPITTAGSEILSRTRSYYLGCYNSFCRWNSRDDRYNS